MTMTNVDKIEDEWKVNGSMHGRQKAHPNPASDRVQMHGPSHRGNILQSERVSILPNCERVSILLLLFLHELRRRLANGLTGS